MSRMMKVCGKTPSGTAKAIHVNENGETIIKRVWESKFTTIFSERITDTDPHFTNAYDCSKDGFVSVRIINNANIPLTLVLMADIAENDGRWARDVNGDYIQITVPENSVMIVTPDDLPILNYLRYLRFRIAATEKDGAVDTWLSIDVYAKG